MKPFARINLSSVLSSVALAKVDALRRGILISSLVLAAGVALMPGDAFAFLGLFEAEPTKAEMERMDALFNGYYKTPNVEEAIALLPSVKKMNKIKPGGIPRMIGFYFGAAKSSAEAWREKWEEAKNRGGKEVAVGIDAALEGKSIDDMVPQDLVDYAPGILDFLWGYFLATGDAEAPRRVILRGGMTVPDRPGVVYLTARAAQWSSVSLAKDHPAVAAELEAFALNADEKSVRNFFGPALNDDARAVLSPAAVARIVSCGVAERRELTERELREAFLKANEVTPSVLKVALSDAPPEIAERLKRLWRSTYAKGTLVFGRLEAEGADIADVATWAWVYEDGTFIAVVYCTRDHIVFEKHGYAPLVVRIPQELRSTKGNTALDFGTLRMQRLAPDKAAALAFTPRLPDGIDTATVTLEVDNRFPVGEDWGTTIGGRERPQAAACSFAVTNGVAVKVQGCSPMAYRLKLSAPGCPSLSREIDLSRDPSLDLGDVVLVREGPRRFALRPFAAKGDTWQEKSVVPGKKELLLQAARDSLGNTCRLRLYPYGSGDGCVGAFFVWLPNTWDDFGELTLEEFKRLETTGNLPQPEPVNREPEREMRVVSLKPGHIYRFREKSHWKLDILIAVLPDQNPTKAEESK